MNQRSYLRAPVCNDGLLSSEEEVYNIEILNIGEGGAFICSTFELNTSENLNLVFSVSGLPSIKQRSRHSQSHIIRIDSCRLVDLRETISSSIEVQKYKYSVVFDSITIENSKKIQNYVRDSKNIMEYLISLSTPQSLMTQAIFSTLTHDLKWFDHENDLNSQIQHFYQDLSWS